VPVLNIFSKLTDTISPFLSLNVMLNGCLEFVGKSSDKDQNSLIEIEQLNGC